MKMSFIKMLLYLVFVIISFKSCRKEEANTAKVASNLDRIEIVPEWLRLNVDEVFSNDSLNIWVPTNNFQTSSLIRVPRLPRKYSKEELATNESLQYFQITNIDNEEVLELNGVSNEPLI